MKVEPLAPMIAFAEIAEAQEAAPARGVSFMQLGPGMCKFPLGALHDPPFWFRGEPAPVGSPLLPQVPRYRLCVEPARMTSPVS